MKCPNCPDTTLSLMERHGVELDYCPQCRGIWLDRGELDRLIERGNGRRHDDDYGRGGQHGDHGSRRDGDRHERQSGHYRGRKSWLRELFD